MLGLFFISARLIVLISIITGIIYPCLIFIIAQVGFNWQANGSLLMHDSKIIGSKLIGQNFTEAKYFHSRFAAASSSGLDPDIGWDAALLQIPRIAKARNITEQEIKAVFENIKTDRIIFILGEKKINVLELNLALDRIQH